MDDLASNPAFATPAHGGNASADVAEIRSLLERWAGAVRARDLDGILARHAADVVLFDVPEPARSRGLDAYRDAWRSFFPWFGAEGIFELSELEIRAGGDVAFCHALVRCRGTAPEGSPADELAVRLTVGLARIDGRWTIVHEHHSVPSS